MYVIRRFDKYSKQSSYLVLNSRFEYWTFDLSMASKFSKSLASELAPYYEFYNAQVCEVQ